MTVTVVIPARYASSRFPGKALAPLRGATGQPKSLIRRSWEAARSLPGTDRLVIATDDARIAEEAGSFGAEVAMTSPDCANGTERCAEAVAAIAPAGGIVVNLQGDAPLTPPWFVEPLIAAMRADPGIAVATPVLRCDARTMQALLADRRAGRVGATTAVFDQTGRALYFSKEVLPHLSRAPAACEASPVFHHVGVYAYRVEALAGYAALSPGPLEAWEGLEQLRFLENGIAVHCIEVEARGAGFWELNNPGDAPRIEAELAARGTT